MDAIDRLPPLPPKVWLANNFSKKLLEERRLKLAAYLKQVLDIPKAAALPAVRHFLEQPREVLAFSDEEGEDVWTNSGPEDPGILGPRRKPTAKEAREARRAAAAKVAAAKKASAAASSAAGSGTGVTFEDEQMSQAAVWVLRGCPDPSYNSRYTRAGDRDWKMTAQLYHSRAAAAAAHVRHYVSPQGRHLYVGPTGKWYLNAHFTPTQDACKAFYQPLLDQASGPASSSGQNVDVPHGERFWQYWHYDGWQERQITLQPETEKESAAAARQAAIQRALQVRSSTKRCCITLGRSSLSLPSSEWLIFTRILLRASETVFGAVATIPVRWMLYCC